MPKFKKKSENIMTVTYKFRAYPTELQVYRAENWFYILCNFYNHAVDERKTHYKQTGKSLSYNAQQSNLPVLKKSHPELKLVHSQVLQDTLQRVDKAYQKFFSDIERKKNGENIKVGVPHRKRLAKYKSFTYPQVWMNDFEIVKLRRLNGKYAVVDLPKFGAVRIRYHRELDWSKAKTVTFKKTSSGKWLICITVEKEICPVLENNGKFIGVDVGVMNLVTTSDGKTIGKPKNLYKAEDKIKKLQKDLSRKQKGSNNYEKQKIKLAKAHEKVANQRNDFLHKLALWLVLSYTYIYFEKLNIKGMVKNHNLAKSIYDSSWGELMAYVTYKSVMLRGIKPEFVSPNGTTQKCNNCGSIVKKTLADRVHACPVCGLTIDRDVNAARNILKVGQGLSEPNACGDADPCLSHSGKSVSMKQEAPSVRAE